MKEGGGGGLLSLELLFFFFYKSIDIGYVTWYVLLLYIFIVDTQSSPISCYVHVDNLFMARYGIVDRHAYRYDIIRVGLLL